ncbi:formin-binding protein 4-like [Lineus longissimus]|uniref:formin-binding protein 4-like n=1 Tax=Lineus longissimus TaxID=88925 RepID=UPI00315D3B10
MYSRNRNKGFGKRRTILQLDDDNPDSSTPTKNLGRTGSSNALSALGSYDNGEEEDEAEQAETPPRPPEPETDPSPTPDVMNGMGQREVTPPALPAPSGKPGGDIDMQVANFLAEIESIDVPEDAAEAVEEAEEEDEEMFDMAEPKSLWQQCLDEGTQCYYYWHVDTNEVTWEIPEDYTQYLLLFKEYEEAMVAFESRRATRAEERKNRLEGKKRSVRSKPTAEKDTTRTVSPVPMATLPETVPLPPSIVEPPPPDTVGPQLLAPVSGANRPESSQMEGPQLPEAEPKTIGPQLFYSDYPDSPPQSPTEQKTLYGNLAKLSADSNDEVTDSLAPKFHFSRSGLGASASSRSNSPLVQGYDSDPGEKDFDWFRRDQRGAELVKKEEKKSFAMKFVKGKTLDEEKVELKTKGDDVTTKIDRNELLQRIRSGGSSWLKAKKKGLEVGPQLPASSDVEVAADTAEGDEDEDDMLERELERRKAELEQLEAAEDDDVSQGEVAMTTEPTAKRESPDPDSAALPVDEKPPPTKKMKTEKSENSENPEEPSSREKHELKKEQEIQIDELSSTITSKLEFLDINRKGLSKLQILLIETQTRLVDWVEGGLSTHHLLKKLKDADTQIKEYELGAAPKGWSCHWDRDYKRYFYQSDETGASQWEYPIEMSEGFGDGVEASSSALEEEVDSSEGRQAQIFNGMEGDGSDITSTFVEEQDQPQVPDDFVDPPPPAEPSDLPPLPEEPDPPPLPPVSPPPPPSSPPPPLPPDDPAPPPETDQPPPPPPGFESNFVPPPPPPILPTGYSPPPLPPGTEHPTYHLAHSPIQEIDMEIDDNEVDSTVPDLQPPPMPPYTKHPISISSVSSSYSVTPMPFSYQSTAYSASTTVPDYRVAPPPPPPPSGMESEDSQDALYPTSSISRLPTIDKPAHLIAQPVLFKTSQTEASTTRRVSLPFTFAPDTTSGAAVSSTESAVPSTSQQGHSASQLAMNLAASVSESGKKKKKIKIKSGGALSLKKKNVSSMVQKWQKAQREVEDEIAQAAARAIKEGENSS